jgi:hypothetical protein
MNEIEKAKEVLRLAGYYVDNLWHVDDVKQSYKCTNEEAIEVLDGALNDNYVTENIFEGIDLFANNIGLIIED